jgi:hypothetical protein
MRKQSNQTPDPANSRSLTFQLHGKLEGHWEIAGK